MKYDKKKFYKKGDKLIKRIEPLGTGLLVYKAIHVVPQARGQRFTFAKLLGTHAANVGNWLYGQKVDPRFCIAIQVFTNGEVSAHQLRPDVFPAPNNLLPVHHNAHKGKKFAELA